MICTQLCATCVSAKHQTEKSLARNISPTPQRRTSCHVHTEERYHFTSCAVISIFRCTLDIRHSHVQRNNRMCRTPKAIRPHEKPHFSLINHTHQNRAVANMTPRNENAQTMFGPLYSSSHTLMDRLSKSRLTTTHLSGYLTLPIQKDDSNAGAPAYWNLTLMSSIVLE